MYFAPFIAVRLEKFTPPSNPNFTLSELSSAFSADIDHHFPLEVDHPISALN
jgi:hypothetical protein